MWAALTSPWAPPQSSPKVALLYLYPSIPRHVFDFLSFQLPKNLNTCLQLPFITHNPILLHGVPVVVRLIQLVLG